MRFNPTKSHSTFLCFIFFAFLIVLSCSKDSDLLLDSVLADDPVVAIQEKETQEETVIQEETVEEPVVQEIVEELFEERTTSFPPTNDAHVQAATGKGYNQNIIRLEEGNRTSYLMFDLSQIGEIQGEITAANLQLTVYSDNGNGNITVYKGTSNDWTEENLTNGTTPKIGSELGSVTKEYALNATEVIELDASSISSEVSTLILDHKNGNDLAFASKEHVSKIGPELVITYNAPKDAAEIVPVVEEISEETPEETVNKEPIAIADGAPSTGKAPLEVTFSGGNSSDDVNIASYKWDFKDGSTSNGKNPKHTFTDVGTYEVELTVTDDEGLSATDMVTINVTNEENKAPTAVLTANPKSGEAPLEVTFKGIDSTDDNGVTSYAWDFKDGSESSNANTKHTFENAGTYIVELVVKDENGLSDKETVTITVVEPKNEAPVAKVSANKTTGEIPLTVQFTGDNSSDDNAISSYKWNFKDGNTSTNANPTHTFEEAGTYVVLLTVKDEEGLAGTKTIEIIATAPSNAAPNAIANSNVSSGEAPLTVDFTGDKSTDDDEVTSYIWNFKDGATSTEANPSHTFDNPGTYRVSLKVTDADGATDIATKTITVTEPSNSGGGSNGDYPGGVKASTFGYNKNDATSAFQAAIKSSHKVIIIDKQSTDWIIQPSRFFNIANKTIVFEPGVVLRAKSGAYSNKTDVMFNFYDGRNILIEGYGATLRMNRGEYGNTEFRHALKIDGGSDITVRGFTILNSGGDGININRGSGNYAENITIEDVISDNNVRQGLSVISGKDIFIRNCVFSGSNGQAPESGIDLEPNFSTDRLQNVNIINCTMQDNNFAGLVVGPGNLNQNSTPISVIVRDCTFKNNARNINHAQVPTEIRLASSESGTNVVKGSVLFERINFNGSLGKLIYSPKSNASYSVTFKNCTAKNILSSRSEHPIVLQGKLGSDDIGGFTFDNFYLEYQKNTPFMVIRVPDGKKVRNISGDFTIKEPNDYPVEYKNDAAQSSNRINVNIQVNHIN